MNLLRFLGCICFGACVLNISAAEFFSAKHDYRIVLPDTWYLLNPKLLEQLVLEGDDAASIRQRYAEVAVDPEADFFLLGLQAPYADNLNVVAMDDVDFPGEEYLEQLPEVFRQTYEGIYESPVEISALAFVPAGGAKALTFIAAFPELELRQRQYMIEVAPQRTLCFTLTTRPETFEGADELLRRAVESFSTSEQAGTAAPVERVD